MSTTQSEVNQVGSPSATDDPAERKRLLNVMAQRRYRNRKKARLASLESKLKNTLDSPNRDAMQQSDNQFRFSESFISNLDPELVNIQHETSVPMDVVEAVLSQPLFSDFPSESVSSFQEPDFSMYLSPSLSIPPLNFDLEPQGQLVPFETDTLQDDPSSFISETFAGQSATSEDSPVSNSSSSINRNHPEKQMHPEIPSTMFSDEAYISIPGLSLIRAHGTIIQSIQKHGCNLDLWDPFAISPFYQSNEPDNSITENYRPTPLQKLIKHHPIFDLLPWPTARNKMLQIMSLPISVRPQCARDEMQHVVMNLIFDMKDAAGGLRVWGQDPFNEKNWEVGQRFFELWWWALDSEIIRNSNKLRKDRGEDMLRLKEKQ